jgi:hypothetical protein
MVNDNVIGPAIGLAVAVVIAVSALWAVTRIRTT